MMHVRVQDMYKMHVCHLALMYYMWCMITMSLILACMITRCATASLVAGAAGYRCATSLVAGCQCRQITGSITSPVLVGQNLCKWLGHIHS